MNEVLLFHIQDLCSFIAAYQVYDISPTDTVCKLKMWRYMDSAGTPLKLMTFTEDVHTEKKKGHDVFSFPSHLLAVYYQILRSTCLSPFVFQQCFSRAVGPLILQFNY